MIPNVKIRPPFFEIGPKSYLVGDQLIALAVAANAASEKYDIDVIFTAPFIEIRRVAEAAPRLKVFAPHMDPIGIGRGAASILPEAVVAAGAYGVMLNHCECPLTLSNLAAAIRRADEVGLCTMVCADSIAEAKAVAQLGPNIIVAEPAGLIGTGVASDIEYVRASIDAVKGINPQILVLQGAGISGGKDVYNVIHAGAEATGSSSGVAAAQNPGAMAEEMIRAVREAYPRSGQQRKP